MPKFTKKNEEAAKTGAAVDDGTIVSGLAGEPAVGEPPAWAQSKPKEPGSEPSITIPVKNGKFDLESLRKKTLERYNALRIATHGGNGESGGAEESFSPQIKALMVQAMFGIVEAAEIAALSRKYPAEIVKQAFHYTPEQLAMLQEPTFALLNKYMPSLDRYSVEAAFLMAFAGDQFMKYQTMMFMLPRVIEMERTTKPDPASPPPPKANGAPARPPEFTGE